MSETVKRERSANWESHEKQLLKEIIKPYLKIVHSKELCTNSNRAKQNAWTEITNKFNAMNISRSRDKKQVMTQWKIMKNSAKKKMLTASGTKQGPRLLTTSVDSQETLEIPKDFQCFKVESIEYEYDCDNEEEENPMDIPDTIVEAIVQESIPSPPPLKDSKGNKFQVVIESQNNVHCKETSTQTSFKKNTNINKNRNCNVFRFSEEFYEDMRYYRDMENERLDKEHSLRVKAMEEQHKQLMKNLQLQEEILKRQLNKFH